MTENTEISQYNYTNIKSNSDYIRAKSLYYNEPLFSNVLINISVKKVENYKINGHFAVERAETQKKKLS